MEELLWGWDEVLGCTTEMWCFWDVLMRGAAELCCRIVLLAGYFSGLSFFRKTVGFMLFNNPVSSLLLNLGGLLLLNSTEIPAVSVWAKAGVDYPLISPSIEIPL